MLMVKTTVSLLSESEWLLRLSFPSSPFSSLKNTLAFAAAGDAETVPVFTRAVEAGPLYQTAGRRVLNFHFFAQSSTEVIMECSLKYLCVSFGRSLPDSNTKTFKCWTTHSLLPHCHSVMLWNESSGTRSELRLVAKFQSF